MVHSLFRRFDKSRHTLLSVNVIIMDISDESCDTDVDVFFSGENEVTALSFAEEEDQVASGR